MKLALHFFLLNDDFSPEYAAAHHGGKASENNVEFEWEDELEINDIISFSIHENDELTLAGSIDGKNFSHAIPKMRTVQILTKNGETKLGVSESILDRLEEKENSLYFYIKDYEPHGNPIPGVYIASKSFPKELSQ